MSKILETYHTVNSFNDRVEVLNDIPRERVRQDRLHGNAITDYPMMYAILMEEVGEVAQALQVHYKMPGTKCTDKSDLYTELIQVSAYAAKFAEQILKDRDLNE